MVVVLLILALTGDPVAYPTLTFSCESDASCQKACYDKANELNVMFKRDHKDHLATCVTYVEEE